MRACVKVHVHERACVRVRAPHSLGQQLAQGREERRPLPPPCPLQHPVGPRRPRLVCSSLFWDAVNRRGPAGALGRRWSARGAGGAD